MAKEIMGISQLNSMTQTDMIRQICILQWSVWGHGNMTSPNANNKAKVLKITDLARSKKKYEMFKAYKLRTDICFWMSSLMLEFTIPLDVELTKRVPQDNNLDHKVYTH